MTMYTLMPLHEALGLAVIGVDLSAPIDAETSGNLRRLLAEHLVLVFPAQSLSPEQYATAATAFGAPARLDVSRHVMPGHPDIRLVGGRAGGLAPDTWHTEHPEHERPPATILLYGVDIPLTGGRTSIANLRAAYWALPEAEQRRLEMLSTVNTPVRERNLAHSRDSAISATSATHPMVRTHPITRERAVYFHPTKAVCIEGMSEEASRDYLTDLVDRMIQPDIIYQHSWVKGDVLVIDNYATWYRADDDHGQADGQLLWQIIIEGDRPTFE